MENIYTMQSKRHPMTNKFLSFAKASEVLKIEGPDGMITYNVPANAINNFGAFFVGCFFDIDLTFHEMATAEFKDGVFKIGENKYRFYNLEQVKTL